jgi:tRNA nucleotidyltransferase/poly(A) polymerase
LKKRGIPPGPKYTEILRRLRAAWLDGEVKNEEQEKALLNKLLEKA